jgi:hypothetical protein
MVAETLTGARAQRVFPAQGHGYGGALYSCWGTYAIAANVEANDIFEMCKTPAGSAGFLMLGGWLSSADMDTGAETLDMDLGWAANGTASAATFVAPWGTSYSDSGYAVSTNGLGNFGLWSGDAVADIMPAGSNYRPIVLPTPLYFAAPTKIQITAVAASAVFAAGSVTCTLIGTIL